SSMLNAQLFVMFHASLVTFFSSHRLVIVLLIGILTPGIGALCAWLYTGLAFSFFLLRSLRFAILPEVTASFQPDQRRKRIHFLLVIVLLSLFLSYFLIIEPDYSQVSSSPSTTLGLGMAQGDTVEA